MLCIYILLNASRYRELTFLVTCMHIIMQLEFNINSLLSACVKEIAFRKCSDGIRKDAMNFDKGLFIWKIQSLSSFLITLFDFAVLMDPITTNISHSLKFVEQYFACEGEFVGTHVPIMSVTDMWCLDKCIDMVILPLQLNSCIIYS